MNNVVAYFAGGEQNKGGGLQILTSNYRWKVTVVPAGWNLPTGVTAFSEAKFEYIGFNYSGGLKFNLSGNNDAMLWGGTPDIDIKGEGYFLV